MKNGPKASSPPSKSQKSTAASSSQNEPISSRVLKTVKQAVYGKQPRGPEKDCSSPNVKLRTPTANSTPNTARHRQEDLAAAEHAIDELGDERDGIMTATPTSSHWSAHAKVAAKVQVVTGGGTAGNTVKAPGECTSKNNKKKFKGWKYLKEGEDVGINNQDAFAKIAEEAANEAVKAKNECEKNAPVSRKNLRERKSRASLEQLKVEEKKVESTKKTGQKRKRKQEAKPSTKKGGRDEEEIESFRIPNIRLRDGSHDELHDGPSFEEEMTSVHVKTPNEKQSSSKKLDGRSMAGLKKYQIPDEQLDRSEVLDETSFIPKDSVSHKKSVKHLTTKSSMDSPFTTAPQVNVSFAASQEDLSTAATRLKPLLSKYPTALTDIKTKLLFQLTSKFHVPVLPCPSKEYETVYKLLSRTVQAGEGNSMLIIGSRGSGKTALVETAISDLMHSNKDNFYVVRLNGFIHTDDKLALREIWRQLGKELEGDDEGISLRSNYADTLTSLLALLSHQDESQEADGEHTSVAKSVVFILDEFDLFAQHSRQTLLYNLFDVAQSHRNAPIAVLGLTTKVNVVDSLEKRVKSRFGQRFVYLSLPQSFKAFMGVCLGALTYHDPSASDAGRGTGDSPEEFIEAWNAYAKTLLFTSQLTEAQHAYYATTNRPKDFQTAIALPLIFALTPDNLSSIAQAPYYTALAPPDSNLALLPTLPILEISLLIAACRLDIIFSTDICFFDTAYEEYTTMVGKSKVQSSASGQMALGSGASVSTREMTKGAWQTLGRVGLIVPAASAGSGSQDVDGPWRADISLEEIGGWLEGDGKGTSGAQGLLKWCREI